MFCKRPVSLGANETAKTAPRHHSHLSSWMVEPRGARSAVHSIARPFHLGRCAFSQSTAPAALFSNI
jgi:hypothetical protein